MSFWKKIFRNSENSPKGSEKEIHHDFLSTLTTEEKISVSNLNPVMYTGVIMEKRGEKVKVATLLGDNIILLLNNLSIEELQALSQSVNYSMQGDEANDHDAFVLYTKALELNPYNDIARMSYGCLLAAHGNLKGGIEWLEKVISLNPKNDRAHAYLQRMRADLIVKETLR